MEYISELTKLNDIEKEISYCVKKSKTNYKLIIIFAFGAAKVSSNETLIDIYEYMNSKYLNYHIVIICFDNGLLDNYVNDETNKMLMSFNFCAIKTSEYIKDNILENIITYEKKTPYNICNIILTNLKIPMNDEILFLNSHIVHCITHNKITEYISFVLQKHDDHNYQFEEFIENIIVTNNPHETIFMNDLFFNSRCYVYKNEVTLYLSQPLEILLNYKNITKSAKAFNINIENYKKMSHVSFYDTNLLYSETLWIINAMHNISNFTKVSMLEHGQHVKSDKKFVLLQYPNCKIN